MSGNLNYPLYEDVKEEICEKIYKGIFKEGEKLPSEKILADTFNVSLQTLKKSLELLEEQGLVSKEIGTGKRICLSNHGIATPMDVIVLIAPIKHPMFLDFVKYFQVYGKEYGAMILYMDKPDEESLTDMMYHFYKKKIQNIVVWKENTEVHREKLARLRALGMNMVFFDTDEVIPYADSVVFDNEVSLTAITECLLGKRIENIGYIGWLDGPKYSCENRARIVLRNPETKVLIKLPWNSREDARVLLTEYLRENLEKLPPAIIFNDGECGRLISEALSVLGKTDIILAGIDEIGRTEQNEVIYFKQNIENTARVIFECIERQNRLGRKWYADIYYIDGELIVN